MSAALEEFTQLLQKQGKSQIPIQTEWCIVKAVDWEDKTMVVESVVNGLDYFDVLLGLGSVYKKPEVGTKALIGLIANTEACFMLDCEAFTEMLVVSAESKFTINENGFIITQGTESLQTILNDLIDNVNNQNEEVKALNQKLQQVIVIIGTSPDVPGLQGIVNSLDAIKNENIEVKQRLNTVLIQ